MRIDPQRPIPTAAAQVLAAGRGDAPVVTVGTPSARPDDVWMVEDCEVGLVSVIIPAFNRAKLLPRALESVSAQTYRPIEVIIVDDGSDDDSLEVARHWGAARGGPSGLRLRTCRQARGGVSAARNTGLRMARGEYIQFLDSDDELLPDKISRHVSALATNPKLRYVWGPVIIQGDGQNRLLAGRPRNGRADFADVTRHHWCVMGPLYRRSVCIAVGPWLPGLQTGEDLLYAAKVKLLGGPHAFIDEPAAIYHSHAGPQLTRLAPLSAAYMHEPVILLMEQLLREYGVLESSAQRDIVRAYLRLGLLIGAGGDTQGQQRCLKAAWRVARGIDSLTCLAVLGASYLVPGTWLSAAGHAWARLLHHVGGGANRVGQIRWQRSARAALSQSSSSSLGISKDDGPRG